MNTCRHNDRTRYTEGFKCHDCKTFFHKKSKEYRISETSDLMWMTLHNINIQSIRDGKGDIKEVVDMKEKIGFCQYHDNHEELISESMIVINKFKDFIK